VIELLAVVGLVAVALRIAAPAVAAWLTAWPAPTPRPYACHGCKVEYSDPRALAWHHAGQHRDTYDHAIDELTCGYCGTPTSGEPRCAACGAALELGGSD
jgi:hypothetical protein